MAEIRVSTGGLHRVIGDYLALLEKATKIEMDNGTGGRIPMTAPQREKILDSLNSASDALIQGCQQTVYGLFLTQPD